MQYTLITKSGKVMQFHIKAVAELYQTLNGGVVITPQVLKIQEILQKEAENGCSLSQTAV
jgi:hypothetical protein